MANAFAQQVNNDDRQTEQNNYAPFVQVQRCRTQDAAADIGQQHLDRHDQRHYIQEAFVLVDVLQQVKTGNTHVNTVGYRHKDICAEEARICVDMVGRIAEQMIDIAALIKEDRDKGHIHAAHSDGRQHFFADYRCAAVFWLFTQVFFQRWLTAEGQCRQSIHDQVDPEDLRNGERFIDADKRCYEVYRYG